MGKGFTIVESGHVVPLFRPQSLSAAGTSDTFCMENWSHASIIIEGGAGSGTTITLYEATSYANSGATAISDFLYAQEATVNGDTLDAALAAASSVAMGTSNVFVVIELDADKLSDGYPYVTLNLSDPGTSRQISAIAILSGGRYQEDIVPTAIA